MEKARLVYYSPQGRQTAGNGLSLLDHTPHGILAYLWSDLLGDYVSVDAHSGRNSRVVRVSEEATFHMLYKLDNEEREVHWS